MTRADDAARDPGQAAPQDPSSSAPAAHGGDAEGGGSIGSVDQIRDIIFGTQMRDYDARFARLEDRLVKESASLREDANRRFDALEAFVRQQFEALGERLTGEQGSRTHAVQELSQRLTDFVQHVDTRTTQIDEQAGQNRGDLHRQIEAQAQALAAEIRSRFDELSATLDRQTHALRDEKTDRASLAGLLTDIARRLHPESA